MIRSLCNIVVLLLVVCPTAQASNVPMEASGVLVGNSLSFGPLAGVPTGMNVHMTFDVDSEQFIDVDPGHNRAYLILNDTFVLTAGEAVLDEILGEHYIHITNDYWVVDGVHWFEENIGNGYWHEFELWGNNGDMFPSTDITECAGEYGPALFEDTSWHINWAFLVSFRLLVIHEPTASADEAAAVGGPTLWASPAPFQDSVRLRYETGAAETGRVLLLDAAGRLIRSFEANGPMGLLVWDARDARGRRVAPGAYFARLETALGCETRKVIRLR